MRGAARTQRERKGRTRRSSARPLEDSEHVPLHVIDILHALFAAICSASVQELTRWYVQMGYLGVPVDVAKVVDPTFAEAAVTRLGPYH
jgi:hypothetical protein